MGAAFEVNRQMCDLEIDRDRWDKIGKEWASKKKEIVLSILKGNDMEKKKMTKAEAFEWLKCKKIDARDQVEAVQKKLFSLGVVWISGDKLTYDYGRYYFVGGEGELSHCDGFEDLWLNHFFEKITAEDILSLEIEEENRSENELDEIVELGEKIQRLLPKLSGHRHVVITETDVLLYEEGMCLSHSDPF